MVLDYSKYSEYCDLETYATHPPNIMIMGFPEIWPNNLWLNLLKNQQFRHGRSNVQLEWKAGFGPGKLLRKEI